MSEFAKALDALTLEQIVAANKAAADGVARRRSPFRDEVRTICRVGTALAVIGFVVSLSIAIVAGVSLRW